MFNCFLSLFVSVQVSDAYVNVLSIIVFFSLNLSFFDMFLFFKKICSTKYVLLTFIILSCKSIWILLSSLHITPKHLKFSNLSHILPFQLFSLPISSLQSSQWNILKHFHKILAELVNTGFSCSNKLPFLSSLLSSVMKNTLSTIPQPLSTMYHILSQTDFTALPADRIPWYMTHCTYS